MKMEEVLKMVETISTILHQTDRDDLIVRLLLLVEDYERINDEISTFVHGEVESSTPPSSEEELCDEPDQCMCDDGETTIEGDKVKVDEAGFHSIV